MDSLLPMQNVQLPLNDKELHEVASYLALSRTGEISCDVALSLLRLRSGCGGMDLILSNLLALHALHSAF